ncbi:flagellin, partial [Thermovirga sp.]|uniref:flagellin n=1 Tax=Thermovirga sp. TaxID=2699834 RepID=UPI0025E5C89D
TQRLVLESLSGEPLRVSSVPWGDGTARGQMMTSEVVGPAWSAVQDGTISIIMGDGKHYEVGISAGNTLSDVAKALADIPGLWAGERPDGSIAVASDNTEPFSFEASGSAVDLFGVARKSQTVEDSKDINRMGLSSFLGLEVNRKSTFFAPGSVIGDTTANKLDMVLSSGENSVRLVIQDDSDLTLSELADRIKAVAGDWLEVVVQKDSPESNVTDTTSQDSEGASERLVIYTKDGSPLNVYDKEGSWSQTLGLNTARYTSDLSNVEFPTAISAEIPAKIGVEIGNSTYEVKLYRDDVIASDGVHIDPRSFALAVQKQVGSDKLNFDLINSDSGVVFYSATGEPLRIYDLPYADPSLGGITSGLASETGLQTGIIGDWVSAATVTGVESSFVIATEGRELSVRVGPSETLADVAEKLKALAGSWIDVSLMSDGTGNLRLGLSAKDGSPLSIYDVEGTPSRLFKVDTDVRLNAGTWAGNTGVLSISVDGYSDDIDLRGASTLSEIADLVNARFGNGDVEAKVVDNMGTEELVFYSPGGKVLTVTPPAGINVVSGPVSPRRGESTGPYNQGVVTRSAANQREEDVFALLDDLAKAVERGSVDIISDSFLPKLDQAIDDALRARALGGALQRRYEAARSRLETDNIAFTEQYSKIMDVDIAEAAMEFQTSQMVYQATLATIAKVVQPTLVDYLS